MNPSLADIADITSTKRPLTVGSPTYTRPIRLREKVETYQSGLPVLSRK